jgi:hypothetical protein
LPNRTVPRPIKMIRTQRPLTFGPVLAHPNKTMTTSGNWTKLLNYYSKQYEGRRTRLGVFELKGNVVNDYWLEGGLPLVGLTAEHGNGHDTVIISMGELTHIVENAIKLTFHCTSSGHEDGVDILDRDNRTTILRFEK